MITLTTPRKIALNDVVKENDTQGAALTMTVDWLGNTATFVFHMGTGAPANFNIGVYSVPSTLVINLTTGAWTGTALGPDGVTTVALSGQVPANALNNFVSQLKSDRNSSEVFAAGASGLMPGTQTPWT